MSKSNVLAVGTLGLSTLIGDRASMFILTGGISWLTEQLMPEGSTGEPTQPTVQIMTSTVGSPILDALGIVKITGNLLWYGLARNVAQTSTTPGGKGGGGAETTTTNGYKYYMSWAMGLLLGEIDTVYAIYRNDDIVWSGTLNRPASGGEETVTLTDMGSATIYFGTDDQVANTKLGAALDDATLNPPYRGLCWVYFDDCYIGTYNRTPTMKFVMRKSPDCSFDTYSTYKTIQDYDYNPMHAIWYILSILGGLSTTWLNSTNFLSVSQTLYDEYRGISILFSNAQTALTYIESINAHIDGILRYDIDATFTPKLIRDDYVLGDLQTLDESVLLDDPTFDRKSWIDTANELKVQYTELITARTRKVWQTLNFGWYSADGLEAYRSDSRGIKCLDWYGPRHEIRESSGRSVGQKIYVEATVEDLGVTFSEYYATLGLWTYGNNTWSFGSNGGVPRVNYAYHGGVVSWRNIAIDKIKYGDILMMAFDLTDLAGGTAKVWFGVNGVWFESGNPAIGLTPQWSNIFLVGTLYVWMKTSNNEEKMWINFGQNQFKYDVPDGFTEGIYTLL